MGGQGTDETLPSSATVPAAPFAPETLVGDGRYRIVRFIAAGGMGEVHEGEDLLIGGRIAIKVLRAEINDSRHAVERLRREIAMARKVTHVNVCRVHDVGQHDGRVFLTMELLEGETLASRIGRGPLDLGELGRVACQLAGGLAALHEAGIVHRDLKSSNVIVTVAGRVVLTDFGLARSATVADAALTAEGTLLGTPGYMAPEQVEGREATFASDIYALGIVLYEMATGQLPFRGQSMLDTMHAIAFDATQPLRTIRADLPYSLQRVVDRCLHKKPDDRYPDLREAVTDLRSVRREIDSGASGGTPILERMRLERFRLDRLRAAVGGLSVQGLMLVGAVILISLIILIPTLWRGNLGGLIPVAIMGGIVYSHMRRRRNSMIRRFTRKASKLKELRLLGYRDGVFIVFADRPTAKTYVKLNALLEAANNGLYQGPPLTMLLREDVSDAEVRETVTSTSVSYLRDA